MNNPSRCQNKSQCSNDLYGYAVIDSSGAVRAVMIDTKLRSYYASSGVRHTRLVCRSISE